MIEYKEMTENEMKNFSDEVASFRKDVERILDSFQEFESITSIDLENYAGNYLRLQKTGLFKESNESSLLRIALAGRYSCGKSSFINDLIGKKVAPVDSGETTRTITRISYGKKLQFFDSEGNCISEADYRKKAIDKGLNRLQYTINVPSDFLKGIVISDVPGFDPGTQDDKTKKIDNEISLKEDRNADIIFLLCRCSEGVSGQNVLEFLKGSKSREGILNADYAGKDKKKLLYVIITMADTAVEQAEREAVKISITATLKKNGIQYEDCFFYANPNDPNCMPLEEDEKVFFEQEKLRLKKKIVEIADKHSGLAKQRIKKSLEKNYAIFNESKKESLREFSYRKCGWLREYLLANGVSEKFVDYSPAELKIQFKDEFDCVYEMYSSAINSIYFCEVGCKGSFFKNYYINARDGRWSWSGNWVEEWQKSKDSIDAFVKRCDSIFRPYLRLPQSVSMPKFELLDDYNDDFFGNDESKVRKECRYFNSQTRMKWLSLVKKQLDAKRKKFEEWIDGSAYDKKKQLEELFNIEYEQMKFELER